MKFIALLQMMDVIFNLKPKEKHMRPFLSTWVIAISVSCQTDKSSDTTEMPSDTSESPEEELSTNETEQDDSEDSSSDTSDDSDDQNEDQIDTFSSGPMNSLEIIGTGISSLDSTSNSLYVDNSTNTITSRYVSANRHPSRGARIEYTTHTVTRYPGTSSTLSR